MRPAFAFAAIALTLSLALAPGSSPVAVAQTAGDSVSGETMQAQGSEAAQATPSGLPRREPVPRTMEAHWPVFALFAVTWIGIVGYLLMAGRRTVRLTSQLREAEEGR